MCLAEFAMSAFPQFASVKDFSLQKLKSQIRYDVWAHQSFKKPRVSLNRGFSLPNFLFEWKECLRLAANWLTRRGLKDRYHALAGYNSTLKGRAQAVANERLQHVYGTRLFLQDAQTMWNLMHTWKDRADRFLSEAGTIKRIYKDPITLSYDFGTSTVALPMFGIPDSTVSYSSDMQVTCNATLAYTYTCPQIRSFIYRLAQLSDTFGVRLDAGIAWDAIPLSFVVDWFVNISEWLHANASKDWVKIEVVMVDYCHSAKVVYHKQLSWTRWTPFVAANPVMTGSPLLRSTSTFYHRLTDVIPTIDKVELQVNNAPWRVSRVINLTALLAQRLLRQGKATPAYFDYRGIAGIVRRAKRIAETRQFLGN